jgi:hypothetical protein
LWASSHYRFLSLALVMVVNHHPLTVSSLASVYISSRYTRRFSAALWCDGTRLKTAVSYALSRAVAVELSRRNRDDCESYEPIFNCIVSYFFAWRWDFHCFSLRIADHQLYSLGRCCVAAVFASPGIFAIHHTAVHSFVNIRGYVSITDITDLAFACIVHTRASAAVVWRDSAVRSKGTARSRTQDTTGWATDCNVNT